MTAYNIIILCDNIQSVKSRRVISTPVNHFTSIRPRTRDIIAFLIAYWILLIYHLTRCIGQIHLMIDNGYCESFNINKPRIWTSRSSVLVVRELLMRCGCNCKYCASLGNMYPTKPEWEREVHPRLHGHVLTCV